MYFNEYVENVSALVSVSSTQTQFFHGPGHLMFIEHNLFPEWEVLAASGSRARHIRIWNSASADADGAYLLAFTLLERFPATSGWRIQILGTDLWARERDAGCVIDTATKNSSQAEIAKSRPEVGPAVEVHRVNLADDVSQPGGPFDLIWCGNVLTYFNYESKARGRVRAPDLLPRRRDRSKTPPQ